MMDILERLKGLQWHLWQVSTGSEVIDDAAAEITRLRAELQAERRAADARSARLSEPGYVRVPDGFVHASDYMEAIGRIEMIRGAAQHCDCRAFEIASDYLNDTHGGQMPLAAATAQDELD